MYNEQDFEECTDKELAREWNRLETLKLSYQVECKMDMIEKVLNSRRVYAWDADGNVHKD
jgi:hypothetical protein